MIYLTQLVYVHEGHEAQFREFEDVVLPLLGKYRGELLLRLRPEPSTQVGGTADTPAEVHVLRFESEADLAAYSSDETRRRYLPLKDQAVRSTLTIKGIAL